MTGYYSTPLIWAASCRDEIARVWLMDCGANIEAMDCDGTALHITAEKGHTEVVRLLLGKG
jgi:ankyrin repeat protein